MQRRRLGRSNLEVSTIGLGCWAIGGPNILQNGDTQQPFGWGHIDDVESVRAIHRALDLGINLFDTANNYGAGHSEAILGRALSEVGRRDDAIISTKFATVFDEPSGIVYQDRELDINRDTLREALHGSLRRLQTDYIDIYLLHNGDYDPQRAPEVCDLLEELVQEGKIRYYGWSTDDPARARNFAEREHCTAIEFRLNVMFDDPIMLALLDEFDLGGITKSPLNGGFLTGKFTPDTTFPENDGRHGLNFREGRPAMRLQQVEAVRPLLTTEDRTMAQGSLAYILARHDRVVPIPGFKSARQVEENAAALDFIPLTSQQVTEIRAIIEDPQFATTQ